MIVNVVIERSVDVEKLMGCMGQLSKEKGDIISIDRTVAEDIVYVMRYLLDKESVGEERITEVENVSQKEWSEVVQSKAYNSNHKLYEECKNPWENNDVGGN